MKDPAELLTEFSDSIKMVTLVDSAFAEYFPKPRYYNLLKIFKLFIALPPTQKELAHAFSEKHNLIYWSATEYNGKKTHYFRQKRL